MFLKSATHFGFAVGPAWNPSGWFYGLFGAVGIVVLVQAAKGLRRLVMRDEDYYESD